MTDGQEVELRGILESISNRFYKGGWGFGALGTDQGLVQITGTLEGHVKGTSLVVRGTYKDSAYGRQLNCSSIVVDSVGGGINVITAWARKYVKGLEPAIIEVCRFVETTERWLLLVDAKRLIWHGVDEEDAAKIAREATAYMSMIETKKGLMELGFTDAEAEKLCITYSDPMAQLEEDPYGVVIDRILSFSRVDAVVTGETPRNDRRRLHAALVQAVVGAQRNGHTAVPPRAAQLEAATIASVYVDAVVAAGWPEQALKEFENMRQLRSLAYAEREIAAWIKQAVELED